MRRRAPSMWFDGRCYSVLLAGCGETGQPQSSGSGLDGNLLLHGLGSVPSDPHLAYNIGKQCAWKPVKIRKLEKLRLNLSIADARHTGTCTRRSTRSRETSRKPPRPLGRWCVDSSRIQKYPRQVPPAKGLCSLLRPAKHRPSQVRSTTLPNVNFVSRRALTLETFNSRGEGTG